MVNGTVLHISDGLTTYRADVPAVVNELFLNELQLLMFNILLAVLVVSVYALFIPTFTPVSHTYH